ncbi:hypothetical protein [Asticcacaulis sp. 201]|uniref:hypothetical protein n=1 Tax=Asticcacaulis sp. 201 TaxID=3028787 RepID=UPI002916A9E8|nr:hypothetical protein [Asticcacaulis sp. 201]MDV6330811.1 hypothetical protein [Asticcacaulis sp. 201]
MSLFVKDGLTLLPELMDNATLKSNVFHRPVVGRDEIGRVLGAFETLYRDVVDIERATTPARELIISCATLPSGQRTTITIVGLRDSEGWIQTVLMTHEPQPAVDELARDTAQLI